MEKIIAVYVRCSGGHNQDLDSQRAVLKEKTAHLTNVLVFEDELSGKDDKRPEYQKLLTLIKGGLVEKVFCWKYDRIGRSTIANLQFAEECKKRSTDIVSVSSGQNLLSADGTLMFTILSAFAQRERENIVENTKRGMAHARAMGKFFGGSTKGWTSTQTIKKLPTILWLRQQKHSLRSIAEQVSLTRKTITRLIKQHDAGLIQTRQQLLDKVPLKNRGKKFQSKVVNEDC